MNWHAFAAAHRRALAISGVVAVSTCAFGAGAFAMRGNNAGEPKVTVENASVEAAEETTTTVEPTTTAAPTTTVAPTTTTTVPPPPPPPTTPPTKAPSSSKTYTFEAPGAGTMTVKLENGVMTVVGVSAVEGWTSETHTASGTEYVKVIFRQGNHVKWVKAWLKNGEVKGENGEWTECDSTPEPSTANYELGGVATITVTWNGSSFTLDAVTLVDGWQVASQETPGDYVRVYFSPITAEPSAQTDGGYDGQRWIKVKIHECQIMKFEG